MGRTSHKRHQQQQQTSRCGCNKPTLLNNAPASDDTSNHVTKRLQNGFKNHVGIDDCSNEPNNATLTDTISNHVTKRRQNGFKNHVITDDRRNSEHSKLNGIVKPKVNGSMNAHIGTKRAKTVDLHLPSWLPWLLTLVTLIYRVTYVLQPTNWWILHPDEVYQTIEGWKSFYQAGTFSAQKVDLLLFKKSSYVYHIVAHTEAYGYGFRPYEFLPPMGSDIINSNNTISAAHAQEIRNGMYSLRSFLLPKLLSFVMLAVDWVLPQQFTTSPYLVVKVLHVIVTSCLPLSVYWFTHTFYNSRQTASLAAILVSSSLCLNVFGTHSLTNSFLAPFVFFLLQPLLHILKTVSMETQSKLAQTSADFQTKLDLDKDSDSDEQEDIINTGIGQQPVAKDDHFTTRAENGVRTPIVNGVSRSHKGDVNANFNSMHSFNTCCREQHKKFKSVDTESSSNTRMSSILQHLLPPLDVYFTLLCGLLLAICCYIRIDSVAIPAILVIANTESISKSTLSFIYHCRTYCLGFVAGVLLGGLYDVIYYGQVFISPMQWFKFNVLNRTSGAIFGIAPSWHYVSKLYEDEPFIGAVVVLVAVSMVLEIHQLLGQSSPSQRCQTYSKSNLRCILVFGILMLLYSGNSHKEMRFLHNTLVFLYMAAARAIHAICNAVARVTSDRSMHRYTVSCAYLFITLFASSHLYTFTHVSKYHQSKWSYTGSTDSNEVNTCLDFIRQRNDVTGVFLDRALHLSGGYSILHKDVPIFALNKYEFMEFDSKSKMTIGLSKVSTQSVYSSPIRVNVFGRISEFISVYNTPYLLKQIIKKKEYNYLVLRADRRFEDTGYVEVFQTGNSRVLQRTYDAENEAKMAVTESRIPIGTNATVLEYEGDWLFHFGLYSKAEQRLIWANKLDPTRIGPFRVLLGIYKKLGVSDSFQRVLDACTQVHSMANCMRPYKPLRLHADYYRKVVRNDRGN